MTDGTSIRHVKFVTFWLFLVELAVHEVFQFADGGVGVCAFDVESDFAAGAGCEHHQTHDALAVNLFTVLFNEDITGESIRGFNEHSRRPGMNAQLVRNQQIFGHARIGSR